MTFVLVVSSAGCNIFWCEFDVSLIYGCDAAVGYLVDEFVDNVGVVPRTHWIVRVSEVNHRRFMLLGRGDQCVWIFTIVAVGNCNKLRTKAINVVVECRIRTKRGNDRLFWFNQHSDGNAEQGVDARVDTDFIHIDVVFVRQRLSQIEVFRVAIPVTAGHRLLHCFCCQRRQPKRTFVCANARIKGFATLAFQCLRAYKWCCCWQVCHDSSKGNCHIA